MLIGYARVSTQDQDTGAQVAALEAAGCEQIYQETASGARQRPELEAMLRQLRRGDVVHVWKLDRLGRSLRDLLRILADIEERGAGFRSLTEGIDTTTPAGRMMAALLGAFAEYERSLLRERTRAGLEQARKRGVRSGPKPKLDATQRRAVVQMVRTGERTAAEAARLLGVHRSTIGRMVATDEARRRADQARGALDG